MTDVRSRFDSFRKLLDRIDGEFHARIEAAAASVSACYARGGTVLACGNGGSAADCSHFAAEFVGRYLRERRALPAISLAAEVSSVTAIGNDYGFDRVFARQVEAFGREGDVLVGLSTSGRSPNVLRAFEAARARGLATIALVGARGLAEPVADLVLAVPSDLTYEIQEVHMMILHSLCDLVETAL